MRRVSMKLGIKERMNDILGTDTATEEYGVPGLTAWSIQAAMIENTRRIVRGVVGDTNEGRVLRGLVMSRSGDNQINISQGVAFTPGGDVIVLGVPIIRSITSSGEGNRHVYLNHLMDRIPSATNPAGKEVTFYNNAGEAEIVYDDKAAAYGTSITPEMVTELVSDYGLPTPSVSSAYLGVVVFGRDGKIDYVTPTVLRGFGPFGGSNMMRVYGINSVEESVFDKKTTLNGEVYFVGGVDFAGNSVLRFTKNSVLKAIDSSDNEKTGQTVTIQYVKVGDTPGTMTFVKGILVEST